ncbi:MAG: glycosyltransferase family 4 protein [Thermomicrobiaceae bacterium]
MKILLSTPFDFSYPGGVNAHVDNLDRALQKLGHTTRILSPGTNGKSIDDDGHVCRIGHTIPVPANGSTSRITLSPFLKDSVQHFLEREQFDIVHLNEPLISTLHLTVLANSQATNFGTFHASNSSHFGYNLLYRLGHPFFSWFSRRLDYRIAVSPIARKFINHYFPEDYQIIPNGIDSQKFGPHVLPDPAVLSNKPTVLFVGRYDEPRKGFRYLLAAMSRVQREMPDARLLVVGPGDRQGLDRQIRRLGLHNVQVIGEVSNEALPGLYAACDVFCAPSTGRESFGIILLEAMALGKPVIASDIDGYRSVTRDGQEGLLVEPRNPDVLSSAILRVLREPELARKLGLAGRERARACSWPLIAQRVVECYESVLRPVDDEQPALVTS